MTEIMRKRPSILALVGEFVSGRVSQHVRMNQQGKPCSLAGSLNHSEKPSWRYWSSGFRRKHVWAVAL
jgi:hypothetical protein